MACTIESYEAVPKFPFLEELLLIRGKIGRWPVFPRVCFIEPEVCANRVLKQTPV
jgi:hypothetical protein